jgi:cytochrome P450
LPRALTRTQTFTHALYTLAAHPEYIAPLREEAEAIAAAEGLTKTSLLKLTKLDSFLRESTRVNTFNGRASALANRWRRRC